MLQYRTVEPSTLALLNKLMQIPQLKKFYLVGGTNLSLKFGHRISVDIDLFSTEDFIPSDISSILEKNFKNDELLYRNTSIGVFATINNIKVDLIRNHNHPLIFKAETIDGIRFYDDRDIAAMKIFTILKRGQKKDFFDIFELLKKYNLAQIIDFYEKKYPSQNLLITIPQAITYFDDAEESEEPISLNNTTWEDVKKGLQKAVNNYLK